MFDKKFFIKHQKLLLKLLNSKLTRRWFRYVLRIDCKEEINQITPNSYTFGGKLVLENGKLKAKLKTDFRCKNKYSKRIYCAFRWLWEIFHIWDLFADNFVPSLSLGFSNTYYPEASYGGSNTSVDGWVWQNTPNSSWSTIRGGAGSAAFDQEGASIYIQYLVNAGAATYDELIRSIITIDTSGIGSGTISDATFSLYGVSKSNTTSSNWDSNIYSASPASNNTLVATDYAVANFGSTAYSTTIAYDDWTNSAYNDFAFNSTGLAAINKTGITCLGWRNVTYDVGNTAPPTAPFRGQSSISASSADEAGTSQDPKLVVTWSIVIEPSNATITLSGQAPTVTAVINVSPSNATITITGQVPTISLDKGYEYQDKSSTTWTHISKS